MPEYDFKRLADHLREQAYLTKGVRIRIVDGRTSKENIADFYLKAASFLLLNILLKKKGQFKIMFFMRPKIMTKFLLKPHFVIQKTFKQQKYHLLIIFDTPEGGCI